MTPISSDGSVAPLREDGDEHDSLENVVETKYVCTPTNATDFIAVNSRYLSDDKMKSLSEKVSCLSTRQFAWDNAGVRKSKSPGIVVAIGTEETFAVIDEGSEINCIDHTFAIRNKIAYLPTKCTAYAAGSTNIRLEGETSVNVDTKVVGVKTFITLHLGKMIVVKNLGVDILIGEPGKKDNLIVTFPHKRMVQLRADNGDVIKVPYRNKFEDVNGVHHCKSTVNVVIYPGQSVAVKLPIHLRSLTHAFVVPVNQDKYSWIQPKNMQVNDGSIQIRNDGTEVVRLSRQEHFATLIPCAVVETKDIENGSYVNKIYDLGRSDLSHLTPVLQQENSQDCFLHEISIDPDNILPAAWKQRFLDVCERYTNIITPKPGKYNGFYGRIDNSINFASIPPPSVRAHLPKYSHDMLKIMGEKMDKLEQWGVLSKPEDIGVVPEFVLPSMLVPKPEEGEWRLVTDFTPLNV